MENEVGRRSTLTHKATGTRIETPLLIPSFSSKGFLPKEIKTIFEISAEAITDALLVSAFDVHHGNIHKPEQFPVRPKLVVLDSGGYETSDEQDLSAVKFAQGNKAEWNVPLLKGIYDKWPE